MALSIQKPLTGEYALCYDADPAFDRSVGDEEFTKAFDACEKNLDYAPITLPGASPTLFVFRPIKALEAQAIREVTADFVEAGILAFRLALVRVENPDMKVEREPDPHFQKVGPVLKRSITNTLGEGSKHVGRISMDLVIRLGAAAFNRSTSPLPP